MIKVYRIETKESEGSNTINDCVCYKCAIKKKNEGFEPVYDLTLSERVPESKMINDCCELCDGTFFLDGRKRHEKIHDIFSLC